LEYFGLHIDLDFCDWIGNILRCPELDLVWILIFVSILLNWLKSPRKILVSV